MSSWRSFGGGIAGPNQRIGAYTSACGFKYAPHQLKLLLAITIASHDVMRQRVVAVSTSMYSARSSPSDRRHHSTSSEKTK